ncbi:MAG: F0F1 ATP synthase subunit A [Alphaproteobacteria bacterium]|nr:F0F1 ATP synthase subunit A [Alphaproteobacteria bacterium]
MANPIHQFVIENKYDLDIAGVDISFTNSAMWMAIGFVVSIAFLTIAMKRKSMVPGRMQIAAEMLYMFIADMVRDTIGPKGARYFPFIFTLFMFVLMGNVLGLLPYSFTYTSHLAVTGGLALLIFAMVILFGLFNHGFKFFSLFAPAGVPWFIYPVLVPIEIISFFVRPLTLSVRLFANMMAGHIMLKVVAGFAAAAAGAGAGMAMVGIFPVFINFGLMAFELLVAFIQAYVFAILTCVYLKDTVELHH